MNDYCENLLAYVMANSSKNREQAIQYLDENCPRWREGDPPKAGVVEVEGVSDED